MRTLQSTRRMVQASLLTALAVILSIWPKFPIFPAVSWMKFEFSDIPVLIGGFALGPWYALGITVIKAVLNGLLTGDANYIGHIMNIVSTGVPTMLAALLYGPFVMVTFDDTKEFLTIPADGRAEPLAGRFGIRWGGREFVPLCMAHDRPYHTYFKID